MRVSVAGIMPACLHSLAAGKRAWHALSAIEAGPWVMVVVVVLAARGRALISIASDGGHGS